jgi:methionyl aminopeptidase
MNQDTIINYLSYGSEIHDIIEDELRNICKPGEKIINIVKFIEDKIDYYTKQYVEKYNLINITYGSAFPVGINLNNIIAHYSPLSDNNEETIDKSDIVTIDYGIHFNGYIIDAAFTFAYDNKYRDLLKCSLDACQESASIVKKDQNIIRISNKISSVIEKYGYKPIFDLCGHQITQYKIHDGFVVPNFRFPYDYKLKVGDLFTIEPFVTTGNGYSIHGSDISHYMFNYAKYDFEKSIEIDFLKKLKTLAFNIRHLTDEQKSIFNKLTKESDLYLEYPPIIDRNKNAKVVQFETTIYIKSDNEIINFKKHKKIDDYILNY